MIHALMLARHSQSNSLFVSTTSKRCLVGGRVLWSAARIVWSAVLAPPHGKWSSDSIFSRYSNRLEIKWVRIFAENSILTKALAGNVWTAQADKQIGAGW